MDTDQINSLAEKIAQIISSGSKPADLTSIQESIDAIHRRIEKLESPSPISNFKFQIPSPGHPSQDRFAIAEAIVDSLFEQRSKEKACTFEPSKPCDHCSMCSSRGF